MSVATMHYSIRAWRQGVGATLVALGRIHAPITRRSRLLIVLGFFMSITALQTSTPSVITVDSITQLISGSIEVKRTPGRLWLPKTEESLLRWEDNLNTLIPAIPYLWEFRTTNLGLPNSLNGT